MSQLNDYDAMVSRILAQEAARTSAVRPAPPMEQPPTSYSESTVDAGYYNAPGARAAYAQYGVPPVTFQRSPYATAAWSVAPLVGFPSAYPTVLNGVPQDYAAPYVTGGPGFAAGGTYGYDPNTAIQFSQALATAILQGLGGRGRSVSSTAVSGGGGAPRATTKAPAAPASAPVAPPMAPSHVRGAMPAPPMAPSHVRGAMPAPPMAPSHMTAPPMAYSHDMPERQFLIQPPAPGMAPSHMTAPPMAPSHMTAPPMAYSHDMPERQFLIQPPAPGMAPSHMTAPQMIPSHMTAPQMAPSHMTAPPLAYTHDIPMRQFLIQQPPQQVPMVPGPAQMPTPMMVPRAMPQPSTQRMMLPSIIQSGMVP